MRQPRAPSRRDVIKLGLVSGLVGTTVYLTNCGSSSKSSGGSTPATPADTTGTVASNHGHVATITATQLSGGKDVTLDLKGTSDHTHALTVTAAQLTNLKGGGTVNVTSTAGGTDAHTHAVSFVGTTSAPATPSSGGW